MGALRKSDSWVRFLITLEKLYPTYVTDLELIQEIECIPRLKGYPTTADIAQYVQTFTTLTDPLATSYYNDSEALLHLLPRAPPKTMDKIRATPERFSWIHTRNSLLDLLYELALQRKSDATLKNLHSMAQLKWLDSMVNANANGQKDQEEAFAICYVRSALWPFSKHEDKDKATAIVVVVVMAVEVLVVAKVKAKNNGIGEGKSRRTTLKRASSWLPCIAPIAGQSTTCETRRGKRALTLVRKTKDKPRKVKAKEERTKRKMAQKEKKEQWRKSERRKGERRKRRKRQR